MNAFRLSLVFLPLLALACSDKDSSDDTGPGESDTDTDADADTDTDTDTDVVPVATISGSVTVESGTAADIQMRLCKEVCFSAWPDASTGAWEFAEVDLGWYSLEAVHLTDQNANATPLAPVDLSTEQTKTLETAMHVPAFVQSTELAAPVSLIGDGDLTVTANPAGMTASAANTPASDEPYFASVKIDPAQAGLPIEGVTGTVVAMWHLGQFDMKLDPTWEFTVNTDLGYTDGDTLEAYVSSYDHKSWESAGTLTLASGQWTGGALPELTTLILVE